MDYRFNQIRAYEFFNKIKDSDYIQSHYLHLTSYNVDDPDFIYRKKDKNSIRRNAIMFLESLYGMNMPFGVLTMGYNLETSEYERIIDGLKRIQFLSQVYLPLKYRDDLGIRFDVEIGDLSHVDSTYRNKENMYDLHDIYDTAQMLNICEKLKNRADIENVDQAIQNVKKFNNYFQHLDLFVCNIIPDTAIACYDYDIANVSRFTHKDILNNDKF
jgi:hypothetical protein